MKNLLKKYWSHIFNIIYLVFIDTFIGFCIIGINNYDTMDEVSFGIMLFLLLIELILTFAVLGEMIYAIIKAAKNENLENKALHIVAIYFLNLFYIPCFLLKHVSKEENVKVKNIVYISITIVLFFILCVLAVILPTVVE